MNPFSLQYRTGRHFLGAGSLALSTMTGRVAP